MKHDNGSGGVEHLRHQRTPGRIEEIVVHVVPVSVITDGSSGGGGLRDQRPVTVA